MEETIKNPRKEQTISIQNLNAAGKASTAEMKLEQCMSFFLKGKKALEANDTAQAIELFKAAIDNLGKDKMSLEDSATFYAYLGLAYQKKGWKEYAQAQFSKALKLNPNEPVALKNSLLLKAPENAEKKAPSLMAKLRGLLNKKSPLA